MSMARMRTFIAIPLDDAVRRKATALIEQLGELGPGAKWVQPETLHVTLLFLGEVDAREILDISKAVRSVTAKLPPFEMRVAGVGGFPNLRRPRTVWLGVDEGADEIVQLHDEIEESLLKLGTFRREDRAFTPHITLGRCKGDDVTPEMHDELTNLADWHGGLQIVPGVQILSSELTREGPMYTILSRAKLLGEGEEVE
jgi:2'-5' RNA ligase